MLKLLRKKKFFFAINKQFSFLHETKLSHSHQRLTEMFLLFFFGNAASLLSICGGWRSEIRGRNKKYVESFYDSNFALTCLDDDEFFAKSAVLNWMLFRLRLDFGNFSTFFSFLLLSLVSRMFQWRWCDVVERIFLIIFVSMKRMNGPWDYVNVEKMMSVFREHYTSTSPTTSSNRKKKVVFFLLSKIFTCAKLYEKFAHLCELYVDVTRQSRDDQSSQQDEENIKSWASNEISNISKSQSQCSSTKIWKLSIIRSYADY